MTVISGVTPSKTKRLETLDIFKEVAQRLFLPEETVQVVWETSIDVIVEALLKNQQVAIRRFGSFYVNVRGRIRFKTASVLRRFFKENTVEKYGVDMNNEAVLMAKVTGECPTCKLPLVSKDPPNCSNCGTKPFERQASMNKAFGVLYGVPREEK